MSGKPQSHGEPADAATPEAFSDPGAQTGRRTFLRSFSRDAVQRAAEAAGLAVALQRETGAAIGAALGLSDAPADPAPSNPADTSGSAPPGHPPVPARSGGTPYPYRVEDDALILLDQQRYPWAVAEVRCTTAPEVAAAMVSRQVIGAPLLAEVTAYGMWLAARGAEGLQPGARRNRVRAMGAAFRAARTNVATVDWAVDRMVGALDRAVALGADDASVVSGMRAAADEIAARMTRDMTRISEVGAGAMPAPKGDTLAILTHDSTGRLAGGEVGSTIGIVKALAAEGRPVGVWLLETHPAETGARLAASELAEAGVAVNLVGVAGAGWLLATRPIDVVVVGADLIALDGSTTATIGTYGLAALAQQHGVPVWIASPLAAVDGSVRGAEGAGGPSVDAEPYAVADAGRPPSASGGPRVRSRGPLQDVTPAALIDVIVTEAGLLRAPFIETIRHALDEVAEPD